jgi:hypothetical protein
MDNPLPQMSRRPFSRALGLLGGQMRQVALDAYRNPSLRSVASTFLLIFSLSGCAASNARSGESPTSAEWKSGDFRVRFQAGPRGQAGRSYSFYEITYATAGKEGRSKVMESAHTTGGFECVTNGDPRNWIRIIQDPNGRAILIEEEIPNDCGPCSNYLWIHAGSTALLEGEYLRLPSKVTGPPEGIDYEYPKVRSLNGDVVRFDYSTGLAVSKRIDQIEKAEHPTPPG